MKRNALLASVAALLFAASAQAVTYDVTIAFDTDRKTTTGCTLTTPGGTFAGVEQVVVTHVNVVGSTATTTGVTRQACSGGILGAAVSVDPNSWPAGLTATGNLFIETHVPPSDLGLSSLTPMRVGFFVTDGTRTNSLMTGHLGEILLIPDGLKHRAVTSPPSSRTITLDGNDNDWTGVSPLSTGGSGNAALRILSALGLARSDNIFFAFRVQANPSAPTANDDIYSLPTVGGTLSVPAGSGVLANDNDPNSLALTTVLVTDVQHGTLTLNPNGGFDYTNDGSSATLDTFEYKDRNSNLLESNVAQVQIGIGAGGGPNPPPTPSFTSADHTTFTAGVAGNFLVVTAPAHPTSTVTIDAGALPNGVSFHDNGDGTATLSGAALLNTCGVYHLTFKAQNVVGTATQAFTLNVVQAPTFSSPNSATFTVGVPGTFTVSTNGCPTPSLSKTGALPNGVTFTDNGNGTGTLAGTPAPGTPGTYSISFTATNSSGSNTQPFTLTVVCGSSITVTNPATSTGTANTAFSQTFTQSGAVGPVTFSLNSGTLPAGLTLATNGTLSGTPTQTGSFPITVKATDSQGCSGVGPTYNLTIGCQVITVNNPATNTGTVNTAFSQTFTATNAIGTTTFSTVSTLPAGLTLAANGTLSGTPTQTGTFPIVVKATDANGCTGNGPTYNLTIGCQVITVNNPATNTGTVNAAFSQTFTATNAIGTVTFTTASTLPTGLTLATNGTLSGTPTQTGTFPIVVHAVDANGCSANGATYNLTIGCQTITVNNPATNTGTVNTAFSQTFTATNAIGTVTFTTASTLPTGLTLATNGTLSGTPTQSGTFPIVVMATDANGCTGNGATYNLTINCQVITVSNPGVSTGTVNTAFSQTFTSSNGVGTVTFTTASTLPAGLTLATNGTLSGTPTQSGSFPIVVTATDANGCTGTGTTYTLVIGCQVIGVTNPVVNTGTVNTAFSQQFTASNTIGTVTFTTASALPAGLTLATDGTLSGTPTQTGSFPIVVTATDANGCSGSGATYTLTIGCQVITVNNPGVNTGTVNAAFSQSFTTTNAVGTVTFTTASTLPTGLTLATNGTLSGTPTQTGTFPIVVHAVDANGCSGDSATYNLTINCQTITVTNPVTNTGTVNAPFTETFTASNTIGTVTFTTASTLPTGLTLATDGTLSGTPTQPGTFPIVVTATDANGCTGTGATYNLIISCQVITVGNPSSNSSPAGTPLPAANFTFTQSGAIGGATFTTASTLPTGVTLTTAGVLTGTPTQGGSFPIVVTVTDGNGCTGTNPAYTLTITCPVITVTNPGVNTGTAGVAFSQTFTQAGGQGTITWSETGALPTGITLNTSSGVLSGTTNQVGTFPIVVTATDANGCTGSGATYNLTINCQTITVTNPGVNTGTVDAPFSQTFSVTGILGTVTWSETGALPAGITLDSSTGVLSGTPTVNGVFPITVIATDTNGCTGSSPYTLTINCQTITVTNPGVNTGTVDAPFSQTFTQSGAHGTATFSTASTLPAGLTLSTAGVLSGTPTQPGTFPIVVTVTDSNGCTGTGPTYNLTINCQTITVTNPGVNTGTVGQPFSQTFTQTGGHGTTTFSTASTLPTGFTLSSAGVLSGTTNQFGTFPIVVTATDANGCTGTGATYNLTINCQTITVTNPANTSGTVGAPFSEQFSETGGIGGGTFTTGSPLPTGLSLSAAGLLSGTPTQAGSFPIVVTYTDGNGCTGTGPTYTLVIGCQTITVTNPANSTGTAGSPFSEQFTQLGAVGTVTWSVTGTLPTGITIAPATGILSGTTSQVGTFPITVTVTDGNGCTGTGPTYNLTINCQTISITNPTLNTVQAGTALTPASSWTFSATGILGTANWTVDTGTLPTGITLGAGTGVLSGSSTQQGTFPLIIKVTDTNGCFATSSYTLTITCPVITPARTGGGSFPQGTIGTAYAGQSFTASGGTGPYTFSVTGGTFPPGLTLASNGTISGTPTATGTFNFTVTATDASTCTGSASFSIAIKPVAGGDSYSNLVNNTQAAVTGGLTTSPTTPFVPLTGFVTANDLPSGSVAVVTGTFSSANGTNNVVIAADGSFLYTPPVTASPLATDTFTYTINSDSGGTGTPTSATGTVTLNLSGRVWYIKNNGAAGNGQSQSPFNTAASFTNGARVTPDANGDIIYVYQGDGLTTNQNSGIALRTNEQLIGEGVALVVNTFTLVPAGTKPLIGNTTGPAVTLANGNTLKGFTATTTVGATLAGISGTSLTTGPTIDTVNVGPTTGAGLNITASATITTSLANVTISNAGTTGINMSNFGTLTVGASVSVSGAQALVLSTGAVSGTFVNVSSTGGTNGVSLTTITGTWGAAAGALTGASGATFNVSGGSGGTITWAGTINQANGATAVTIAGSNSNTINFTNNVTTSGTSTGLSIGASSGTYAFSGGTNTIAGSGGGIAITSATGTVTFNSNFAITQTSTNASFSVTNSSATITYSGTINNVTATSKVLAIDTYSTNTLTMNGTSLVGNVAGAGGITSTLNNITGTVVINNLSITASQNAFAGTLVNITGTNTGGSMTFNHLTLSATGNNHTGQGLVAVGGGTLVVTATGGASTINTGGAALSLNGQAVGTSAIGTLTCTAPAAASCVSLTGVSGSLTIGGGAITGNTAAAFAVSGGTVSVSNAATIAQASNAAAVSVSGGHATGTLTFSANITPSAGTGLQFDNADGTYNISGTTNTLTGTARVDILNGSSGSFTFSAGTSITNPGVTAFNVSASNPTATYSGSISTNNSRPVSVSNGAAAACGSITFQTGNITATAGSNGILVNNCNSGTISFNNPSVSLTTTTNTAVSLTTNAGATISFGSSGPLVISTTNGSGINATGGGTVNVSGTTNTISTTGSGAALSIVGTSGTHFGGSQTFQSINKSGSGTKGIVVNFSDGSFTVTGDGADVGTAPDSATSGGTITGTSARGAEFISVLGGVNLGGMTFTNATTVDGGTATECGIDLIGNDNTTCNAPIFLQQVGGATGPGASSSLNLITVNGSTQTGINVFTIRNLNMTSVSVTNSGNAINEHGVVMKNLLGTSNVITNSSFTNNSSRQLYVINTVTEAPTPMLSITSTTFTGTGVGATNMQGALFDSYTSGNIVINVGDDTVAGHNTFQNSFSNGLQQSLGPGAQMTINIKRNTFTNNNSSVVLQAAGVGSTGTLNYTVWNNTMTTGALSGSGAIIASATQTHVLSGDIRGNLIGNGSVGSGAVCGGGCTGIQIDHQGSGAGRHDVTIIGNTVRHVDSIGIRALILGIAKGNVVITGNLIQDPDGSVSNAIEVRAGNGVAGNNACLTATLGGAVNPGAWPSQTANAQNQIIGSWDPAGSQSEIFVWNRTPGTNTLNIPGGSAPFNTFIGGNNNIPDATGPDVTTTGTMSNGASCP